MLLELQNDALVIRYNNETEEFEFFCKPTEKAVNALKRYESSREEGEDLWSAKTMSNEDPYKKLFDKMDEKTKAVIRDRQVTKLDSEDIVYHSGKFYYDGDVCNFR